MTAAQFGTHLKDWRRARRLSQLDLALMADVSARHVSFLETGRARPSRDMVLRLARTLEVPLKERNDLLSAAGFAPAYRARDLSDAELTPLRHAIEHLLAGHDPYPAYVLDRTWDLVDANVGARRLLGGLLPADAPADARPNMVRLLLKPGPLRDAMVNWDEVARLTLLRLRREVRDTGGDAARLHWRTSWRAICPTCPKNRRRPTRR